LDTEPFSRPPRRYRWWAGPQEVAKSKCRKIGKQVYQCKESRSKGGQSEEMYRRGKDNQTAARLCRLEREPTSPTEGKISKGPGRRKGPDKIACPKILCKSNRPLCGRGAQVRKTVEGDSENSILAGRGSPRVRGLQKKLYHLEPSTDPRDVKGLSGTRETSVEEEASAREKSPRVPPLPTPRSRGEDRKKKGRDESG